MAMVYDSIFPYLKGFHLTLASHLPHRDDDGWKMTDLEWIAHLENKVESGDYSREQADTTLEERIGCNIEPPKLVVPVPRFYQCLKVLGKMFREELPPIISVRSTRCQVVVYGFVDASESGFECTLLIKGNIEYRIGTWSSSEDTNSSN